MIRNSLLSFDGCAGKNRQKLFTAIKIALQFIFLKALLVELNCSLAVSSVLPEDFACIWAYTRLLDDRKH